MKQVCERHGVKKDEALWKEVCVVMGQAFATLSETVLISILQDSALALESQRTRINKH